MAEYRPIYENSYALVVGVDHYEHLNNLSTAVYGAQEVGSTLEALGFQVDTLIEEEATRAAILDWLEKMADTTGINDRVFFYFAGHAVTRPATRSSGEAGYLQFANTRRYRDALSMNEMLSEAQYIRAKHVFYALDCCFSGLAIPRRGLDPSGTRRVYKDLMTRPSVEVLTAGDATQTASDRLTFTNHSPFTHYFLCGLRDREAAENDGIIYSERLAIYVKESVQAAQLKRPQTPQYYAPPTPEGKGGSFVFVSPYKENSQQVYSKQTTSLLKEVCALSKSKSSITTVGKLIAFLAFIDLFIICAFISSCIVNNPIISDILQATQPVINLMIVLIAAIFGSVLTPENLLIKLGNQRWLQISIVGGWVILMVGLVSLQTGSIELCRLPRTLTPMITDTKIPSTLTVTPSPSEPPIVTSSMTVTALYIERYGDVIRICTDEIISLNELQLKVGNEHYENWKNELSDDIQIDDDGCWCLGPADSQFDPSSAWPDTCTDGDIMILEDANKHVWRNEAIVISMKDNSVTCEAKPERLNIYSCKELIISPE